MNLRHVDLTAGMRRLADRRIEQAMAEGKFDRLEGAGKLLNLDPMPANEDARLTWWALRLLARNDVIPDEIRWRKQVDHLKEEARGCRDPKKKQSLVAAINGLVRQINTLGTNALNTPVTGFDFPSSATAEELQGEG